MDQRVWTGISSWARFSSGDFILHSNNDDGLKEKMYPTKEITFTEFLDCFYADQERFVSFINYARNRELSIIRLRIESGTRAVIPDDIKIDT